MAIGRSSTDVEAYFRLGRMQGSAGSVGEKRELFIERRRVAWRRRLRIWNWSWDRSVYNGIPMVLSSGITMQTQTPNCREQ